MVRTFRKGEAVEYFSFEEVMRELELGEEELKRMVTEGELRAIRENNELKFRKDDVKGLKLVIPEPTIISPEDWEDVAAEDVHQVPAELLMVRGADARYILSLLSIMLVTLVLITVWTARLRFLHSGDPLVIFMIGISVVSSLIVASVFYSAACRRTRGGH